MSPTGIPSRQWTIIAADDLGLTVEKVGDSPAVADLVASWAQQEEDRWPEMGLVYMLVEPRDRRWLNRKRRQLSPLPDRVDPNELTTAERMARQLMMGREGRSSDAPAE